MLIKGPFSCLQIVIELYRLLEKINREVQFLHHTDTICDFLYPFSLICGFTLKVVNYSVSLLCYVCRSRLFVKVL